MALGNRKTTCVLNLHGFVGFELTLRFHIHVTKV